eukprot:m.89213 g.89213  ORF g.89213 m.89213 type:complete len:50 (-) comp12884_c0_seq6:4-153(-)
MIVVARGSKPTTVSKDDATTTHVQCLVVSMNATGLLQGKVAVCDKGWQR